jgi:predicted DNA-binding ribbon-helix-helix protein
MRKALAVQPPLKPQESKVKSEIKKRSAVIAGHKTSVSMEDRFWLLLEKIAIAANTTRNNLIADIDSDRKHYNLSSAIRVFVLDHYVERVNEYEAANPTNDTRA